MGRLSGKVAIVTGSSRGIGFETARAFAREGALVTLAGREEETLARAAGQIAGAHWLVADVSVAEDCKRLVETTLARHGKLDVMVANAGIEGAAADIADYPIDMFDRVMAVNVRGVFLTLKYAIPAMKPAGGSIVITSSIGGIKSRGQGNSAYIASKHAEIGLMRSAASECAPHGIRVNCVLPGPTETRMMRNIERDRAPDAPEQMRAAIMAALPFKRYGTPEEVANLILFLASDQASVCTVGVYAADGGLSGV